MDDLVSRVAAVLLGGIFCVGLAVKLVADFSSYYPPMVNAVTAYLTPSQHPQTIPSSVVAPLSPSQQLAFTNCPGTVIERTVTGLQLLHVTDKVCGLGVAIQSGTCAWFYNSNKVKIGQVCSDGMTNLIGVTRFISADAPGRTVTALITLCPPNRVGRSVGECL